MWAGCHEPVRNEFVGSSKPVHRRYCVQSIVLVGGWVGREGGNEPLWNGFIGHISLRHSSSLPTVATLLLGWAHALVTIKLANMMMSVLLLTLTL